MQIAHICPFLYKTTLIASTQPQQTLRRQHLVIHYHTRVTHNSHDALRRELSCILYLCNHETVVVDTFILLRFVRKENYDSVQAHLGRFLWHPCRLGGMSATCWLTLCNNHKDRMTNNSFVLQDGSLSLTPNKYNIYYDNLLISRKGHITSLGEYSGNAGKREGGGAPPLASSELPSGSSLISVFPR